MRSLSLAALACAALLCGQSSPYRAPGAITGPWEEEVNLSATENAGASIQSALKRYLSGSDTTPYIRIYGSATVTNSHTHLARYKNIATTAVANSVYRYLFAEIPSSTFEGVYPVSDGDPTNIGATTFGGLIFWDNAEINFNCTSPTTQSSPTVLWQMGDAWLQGRTSSSNLAPYGGDIAYPPEMAGTLTIRLTGDCDGGRNPGTVVSRSPDTLISDATSTVAIWLNGMSRRNSAKLSVRIVGSSDDNNDFGVWNDGNFSASNRIGDIRITNTAVGRMFTGHVISPVFGGYLSSNDFGVWVGDPTYGADVLSATTCVAGTVPIASTCGRAASSASSLSLFGARIEGNAYGEVVMFDGGSANSFVATHIEPVTAMLGHAFLIGAGTCSTGAGTRQGMVGATAADCPGGSLVLPKAGYSGVRSFSDTRFLGGYVPGDSGCTTGASACGGATALSDWNGLEIGAGANDVDGRITIHASLLSSTIQVSGSPQVVAFGFAPELGSGNLPLVDVSSAVRTGGFLWPAYAQIWGEEINIPFGIDDSAVVLGTANYLTLGEPNVGALITSSSYDAFVPLPRNEENKWQFHRIDFTTSEAYAGTDECTFVPAFANTSQGTITDITGTTASVSGTTIAANTSYEWAFNPHASLVSNPTDNDHQIGLRLTTSATCNEMHGKGSITLLRLK